MRQICLPSWIIMPLEVHKQGMGLIGNVQSTAILFLLWKGYQGEIQARVPWLNLWLFLILAVVAVILFDFMVWMLNIRGSNVQAARWWYVPGNPFYDDTQRIKKKLGVG
jgi:hypothetical protein